MLGGDSSKKSSTSLRKAVYAKRDQGRSMDPGALDFAENDDDDEEEATDLEDNTNEISSSRGRQHAFKILEARNKIPAAGMWRSLAT